MCSLDNRTTSCVLSPFELRIRKQRGPARRATDRAEAAPPATASARAWRPYPLPSTSPGTPFLAVSFPFYQCPSLPRAHRTEWFLLGPLSLTRAKCCGSNVVGQGLLPWRMSSLPWMDLPCFLVFKNRHFSWFLPCCSAIKRRVDCWSAGGESTDILYPDAVGVGACQQED